MKKGPRKTRAPKPKAPKASKIKQKQKQSVNVKIHIDNSKTSRARARAPAHPTPFRQPIDSYPIFRDIPPPPPAHYNPAAVVQPLVQPVVVAQPLVAQGFHGIRTAVAAPLPMRTQPRAQTSPPRRASSTLHDFWTPYSEAPIRYSQVYGKPHEDDFVTYSSPPQGNTRSLVNQFEAAGTKTAGTKTAGELPPPRPAMQTSVRNPNGEGNIEVGGTRWRELVDSGEYIAGPKGGLKKKKKG